MVAPMMRTGGLRRGLPPGFGARWAKKAWTRAAANIAAAAAGQGSPLHGLMCRRLGGQRIERNGDDDRKKGRTLKARQRSRWDRS
jgi:hypothetical protein